MVLIPRVTFARFAALREKDFTPRRHVRSIWPHAKAQRSPRLKESREMILLKLFFSLCQVNLCALSGFA
jgi:hypothetical protein